MFCGFFKLKEKDKYIKFEDRIKILVDELKLEAKKGKKFKIERLFLN
jgi:hypothetical protein